MTIVAAALLVLLAPVSSPCPAGAVGALSEATDAETFLKQEPSTRLAPYIYLFIAHRQRCAFEAHDAATNVEGMKAAAKKYRAFMLRLRANSNPEIARRADALDKLPFVSRTTDKHPRTFNPDG